MRKIFFLLFIVDTFLSATAQQSPDCAASDSNTLAFISDTQAPMWVETLFLKSHENRKATKQIFGEMCSRKPKALFILGDVVNLGYSKKQWRSMSSYLTDLRKEGTMVHAALGNHEVMGRAKKGEEKFQSHFPDHVRTGFVTIYDSVAVVLLNSNFNKLTTEDDNLQLEWYQQTLSQLEKDSSVLFVITGCHHSPFTNSKVVGCSADVEEKFVQPFLASSKSRLFISGHSHNFEHFQKKGKDFLVIGGGGGLHQPLKKESQHNDLAADYKPLFHYLTINRINDQLHLSSYELDADMLSFQERRKMILKNQVSGYPDNFSASTN